MIDGNLLLGEKVRLNAFEKDDLPTMRRWYEDSQFARLFDASPAVPRNLSRLETWLEDETKTPDVLLFAIRSRHDDRLVGLLTIDGIIWAHQVAWLSIGIGEAEARGKGYGYDAMRLALNFAFNELNLHRIQLTVFSYNAAALALYNKLGFTHEGTYRQFLQRDGQRHDMLLYGLLRDEWTTRT